MWVKCSQMNNYHDDIITWTQYITGPFVWETTGSCVVSLGEFGTKKPKWLCWQDRSHDYVKFLQLPIIPNSLLLNRYVQNGLKDLTRCHGTLRVDCVPSTAVKVPHFSNHWFPQKSVITYVVNLVRTWWILIYFSAESNSDLSVDYHPRTRLDQSLSVIRQWVEVFKIYYRIFNIAGKIKVYTHVNWNFVNKYKPMIWKIECFDKLDK